MKKIRVGIVNYLNTKPLIYGLERPPINEMIELTGAYPSMVAKMLRNDEIDVGLVPIGSLTDFDEYHVVGNYGIAADGEIASVCLFSEVPMDQIEKIYLDYQSRSSVKLLKWLMRESWGIRAELIPAANDDFRSEIKGTTAGLIIGDRALEQRKISTFIYDLGSEWRAITGLPFVFAAWISTRKLPDGFVTAFDTANEMGLCRIDEIVNELDYEIYDLSKYYKLHLGYELNEQRRKGMELFIQYLQHSDL